MLTRDPVRDPHVASVPQDDTNIMQNLPSVAVIIPTWNSSDKLEEALQAIKNQDYQGKVEIIGVDGGSTDSTLEILKKYGCTIYQTDPDKQGVEYNKAYGIKHSNTDLVLMNDDDNVMASANYISKMVRPFLEDPDLVGAEPLRFGWKKSMNWADRYFALFGNIDPVAYYFGKDARLSWAFDTYNLFHRTLEDKGDYYLVTFDTENVPTLGGNGFVGSRKMLDKVLTSYEKFFHMDINYDLIEKGFNKYAFPKVAIYHYGVDKGFWSLIRRRQYWAQKYHLNNQVQRRYSVYVPIKDRGKLIKFIFLTVTFVEPLFESIRGYLKKPDIAWFAHPFVCLAFLYAYASSYLQNEIKRRFS